MALTKVIGAGLGTVTSANLDGAVTINESSANVDFRVEGDGDANLLFVDAGNNRIGIGTNSPTVPFTVKEENAGFQTFLDNDNGSAQGLKVRIKANDSGDFSIFNATSGSTGSDIEHYKIEKNGQIIHYANVADSAYQIQNDGNNNNRWGIRITCGADDGSGTNYAVIFRDGDGSSQGSITFSGGTVTYGAFTAHHPCIIPNADNNASSTENAYPYGTLLETTSISYTQKDGADTERGIQYNVQKTQSVNSKAVLGAYGSCMNGGPDGETNLHQALVLGDGHILCNNAGGNIAVGDGICSSATAGIGQKATANPSMIIGIAQEAVTFSGNETKLVPVQYGLQQFVPWS